MSSGKSTLITEYLHAFESVKFTPPPVTVTYKGLNFEFIDSVFAVEENGNRFNFYELDAPTISKWFQFVEIANAVVIVYNHSPRIEYGTHESLADAVFSHIENNTPVIFVLNNFENIEEAKLRLHQKYDLDRYKGKNIIFASVEKGEPFFDTQYGNRVKLDPKDLQNMVDIIKSSIIA
ncbi:MAG: hypothetical protein ACW99A_06580 [Candidatus Kariarchaeaceae archaeon]|jgi:hypothetical protein